MLDFCNKESETLEKFSPESPRHVSNTGFISVLDGNMQKIQGIQIYLVQAEMENINRKIEQQM
jgi:hypothetical protein